MSQIQATGVVPCGSPKSGPVHRLLCSLYFTFGPLMFDLWCFERALTSLTFPTTSNIVSNIPLETWPIICLTYFAQGFFVIPRCPAVE